MPATTRTPPGPGWNPQPSVKPESSTQNAPIDLGATKLEAVGEFQHGPAVVHGGPGIGGADCRYVGRDRLGDPGRRDEAADHTLALVGLKPVDAASVAGEPLPDRQKQLGHDVDMAVGEVRPIDEFGATARAHG